MSRRRRRELGNAQEATDRIERRRHVHIEVGVHTTSYRARRIYSGHRHPFLLIWSRGGTRRPCVWRRCDRPVATGRSAALMVRLMPRAPGIAGRRIVLKTG